MKVKVIDITNESTDNFSTIWFTVKEYPENVFGLKHFPNAEYRKYYIVTDESSDYFREKNKIDHIEQN